jgi:hypothetical protein
MKTIMCHGIIAVLCMMCSGLASRANAQSCTPSSAAETPILAPCYLAAGNRGDIKKTVFYNIGWPDGATNRQPNSADGQCMANFSCALEDLVYCWPSFDQPVRSANYWSQTAYEARAEFLGSVHTCPNPAYGTGNNINCTLTGLIRTQVVHHICTSC